LWSVIAELPILICAESEGTMTIASLLWKVTLKLIRYAWEAICISVAVGRDINLTRANAFVQPIREELWKVPPVLVHASLLAVDVPKALLKHRFWSSQPGCGFIVVWIFAAAFEWRHGLAAVPNCDGRSVYQCGSPCPPRPASGNPHFSGSIAGWPCFGSSGLRSRCPIWLRRLFAAPAAQLTWCRRRAGVTAHSGHRWPVELPTQWGPRKLPAHR